MSTKGEMHTRGLALRREVLGHEHVKAASGETDSFGGPLQDLVTEFGWGAVWSRPGLDRKTRSLLTLALLTSLDKNHELSVHAHGALRNGATVNEIREVLLHAAVYCGLPAALSATRVVEAALASTTPESFSKRTSP